MIDTSGPELSHALNPAQQEAVDHVHGPILVLAGALITRAADAMTIDARAALDAARENQWFTERIPYTMRMAAPRPSPSSRRPAARPPGIASTQRASGRSRPGCCARSGGAQQWRPMPKRTEERASSSLNPKARST